VHVISRLGGLVCVSELNYQCQLPFKTEKRKTLSYTVCSGTIVHLPGFFFILKALIQLNIPSLANGILLAMQIVIPCPYNFYLIIYIANL